MRNLFHNFARICFVGFFGFLLWEFNINLTGNDAKDL